MVRAPASRRQAASPGLGRRRRRRGCQTLAVQDERACILGSAVRVAPPAEPQRLALVSVQVAELLRPGVQPAADCLPALHSPSSATRPAPVGGGVQRVLDIGLLERIGSSASLLPGPLRRTRSWRGETRQGRTRCAPVQVPAPDQAECQAAERTRRMPASERLANARSATPTHTARARATRIVPRHSPALVSSMAPSPRRGIRHTDESGLVSWRVPTRARVCASLQSL